MARFRTRTISRRTVEALKTDRDTMFWDRELPGFVMYDFIPLI